MIPEVNPYNNYRGDGSATHFDYDFMIQNGSQLIVQKIDENDVAERLVENIDYEIAVIDDEYAGYIRFPIEDSSHGILQENETLSLQLTLPFEQISEYGQSSLLDLNSIEFSLDYLTRLCQILKRQLERSVKVNEGSDSTPTELLDTINNNALVSTNAAALASKKADEAFESANITIEKAEEIDGKILGFNEAYEEIVDEITQEGEKQLQNIQSTGFYMRDDKLYFINSEGEEEEFKSGGLFTGQTIFSLDPLFEDTLHLLDGALLSVGGMYDQFIKGYIANLFTKYPQRFCTEEEWQTSVSTYGVCGKYVYNEGVSVRLPKVTGIVEGTLDANALGEVVEAGLPNIEGSMQTTVSTNQFSDIGRNNVLYDGAISPLYLKQSTISNASAEDNMVSGFSLDASLSNAIYGKSSTVQPQTIKGYYYIVVATGSKTDIEVNLDNIATDLNGKADTDLTNVTSQAKAMMSTMGMPSSKVIGLTIGASGTTYTAPANGWYCVRGAWSSRSGFLRLNNGYNLISYAQTGAEGAADGCCNLPVAKGQQITLEYSGNTIWWFVFIYAIGSESEAE